MTTELNPSSETEAQHVSSVLSLTTQAAFRTCACGAEFELPPFEIAARYVTKCPKCSDASMEAERQQMIADARLNIGDRTDRWTAMCPPLYLETEPHKLPMPSKLDRVMQWRFGPKGLILHGQTAKGKTRCAYVLIKREFLAGKNVSILDSAFGFKYAAIYSDSAAAAMRFIEHKFGVDILMLDDVLKVKLTDSVEQALFVIVNTRIEQRRPIIATLNDTGETLGERLSLDRGPALIRRLREFCETISF